MAKSKGLGKGLDALIPQAENVSSAASVAVRISSETTTDATVPHRTSSGASVVQAGADANKDAGAIGVQQVAVESIAPNPHQPRTHFDPQALADLTASIKEHGVLQPLIVTPRPGSGYELLAGERRWRASKEAGLDTVPVVVRTASEQEKLELAILENVQRDDLNPIEEAKAYMRLIDEFQFTQEDVAKRMGKQRSSVANILRLLQLPRAVQEALASGLISSGHAKVLLSIEPRKNCLDAFMRITEEGLSVRALERLVKGESDTDLSDSVDSRATTAKLAKDVKEVSPELRALVETLQTSSGLPVDIKPKANGGVLQFRYFAEEDIRSLIELLKR